MEIITRDLTLVNFVAGFVIIGVGIVLGSIFGKLSKKIIKSLEIEMLLKEKNIKFPFTDFVYSITRFGVYIAAVILGVFQMGIERVILIIFLTVLLLMLVIKVVTSLLSFWPNFVAGFRNNIKKGDEIGIETIKGKILGVGFLETVVKSKEGDILYIPNMFFLKRGD